jgi:hypothetical protein
MGPQKGFGIGRTPRVSVGVGSQGPLRKMKRDSLFSQISLAPDPKANPPVVKRFLSKKPTFLLRNHITLGGFGLGVGSQGHLRQIKEDSLFSQISLAPDPRANPPVVTRFLSKKPIFLLRNRISVWGIGYRVGNLDISREGKRFLFSLKYSRFPTRNLIPLLRRDFLAKTFDFQGFRKGSAAAGCRCNCKGQEGNPHPNGVLFPPDMY